VLTDRLADAWLAVLTCRSRRRTSASNWRAIRLPSTSTAVMVDLAQERSGPGGGQLAVGAAGLQVGQQHVQPAQGRGGFGDQVVAAVAQPPQTMVWSSSTTGRNCRWWRQPQRPSRRRPGRSCGRCWSPAAGPGRPAWPARQRPAPQRPPAAGRSRGPGRWRPPPPSAAGARRPPRPAGGSRPGCWPARAAGRAAAVGIQGGGGQRALVGVDADGDHGVAFRRGGQRRSRDGQPDFRSAHASVEPRHDGCRPQPGTLSASQPSGWQGACEPDGRHPGRYGLQTRASWPPFNKSGAWRPCPH